MSQPKWKNVFPQCPPQQTENVEECLDLFNKTWTFQIWHSEILKIVLFGRQFDICRKCHACLSFSPQQQIFWPIDGDFHGSGKVHFTDEEC